MLAGAVAALGAAVHDIALYYPDTGTTYWIVFAGALVVSGVLVAGVGGWLLFRALAATGVLGDFAAGGEQRRV
jgi:energy-coupling factor transport system substrate-specific component